MSTARDIIKRSLQNLGVLTKGESPSSDESNDALSSLNAMLSSWSTDSLTVYSRAWEVFTLTNGVGEYTIGVGGDFNTARPVDIVEAHIKIGTLDYNMDIVSDINYNQAISLKTTTGIPTILNYDNSFPIAKIRLWTLPSSSSYNLNILSEKALGSYAIDDVVALPDGWERAIIFNLAVELSAEYGQQVSQDLSRLAYSSKKAIKHAVSKVRDVDYPKSGGSSSINIYTGYDT